MLFLVMSRFTELLDDLNLTHRKRCSGLEQDHDGASIIQRVSQYVLLNRYRVAEGRGTDVAWVGCRHTPVMGGIAAAIATD